MTPELRARAIYDVVANGLTVTDGELTVSVTAAELTGRAVELTLEVADAGVPREVSNPFVFVNPPTAVVIDGEAVVDELAAATEMILAAVR